MSIVAFFYVMKTDLFIVDEMLKGLARWLRVAGYDTFVAESGDSDRKLLALAKRRKRLLITRDRKFAEMKDADRFVLILQANSLPGCLKELSQKLALNWHYQPFSRCVLCNTLLTEASAIQQDKVPTDVRANSSQVLYCPSCDKVYWQGGHVRRMREKLMTYEQGDFS